MVQLGARFVSWSPYEIRLLFTRILLKETN
jgi:hypothetical protein